MRASMAYFVGAGTIIVAIGLGLGGGLVAGNIMSPTAPKQGDETAKMEQPAKPMAAADKVAAVENKASQPVPYLAESIQSPFGAPYVPAAQASPEQAAAEKATAKSESSPPQPAGTAAQQAPSERASSVRDANAKADDADVRRAASAKTTAQQGASERASSAEDANGKADDADAKHAASEQRRAERHRRWVERHRRQREAREQREARQQRDRTDWNDVARAVHEDSDYRDSRSERSYGYPQVQLFGPDD